MSESSIEAMTKIFDELMHCLWERLASLIGETATLAIFRSALLEATTQHPLLARVVLSEQGLNLDALATQTPPPDLSHLRQGLMQLTDNVLALLIDLTGEILLGKVNPLVQQYKQKLEDR